MYSTSSGARRKLTGTRMRPLPLTPKKLVSSRAEFWLTTATRSPWPIPSASSPAACARARSRDLTPRELAPGGGRLVRLVDHSDPVGVDQLGAAQEVVDGERNLHGADGISVDRLTVADGG